MADSGGLRKGRTEHFLRAMTQSGLIVAWMTVSNYVTRWGLLIPVASSAKGVEHGVRALSEPPVDYPTTMFYRTGCWLDVPLNLGTEHLPVEAQRPDDACTPCSTPFEKKQWVISRPYRIMPFKTKMNSEGNTVQGHRKHSSRQAYRTFIDPLSRLIHLRPSDWPEAVPWGFGFLANF
ncbi:hypothetical protein GALMADRAFT_216392 [Galerina marginata CBS 339.88]|uniref:Uncharacterized protein n=1 Tax=Galerina marginata (strain CBS 339.88) TaxID=685588 RepID=A0A067SLA1_GALM3|nr:hypothetical protein GALMADRAFT_216392 [Galerina marginata CBS 339.88]